MMSGQGADSSTNVHVNHPHAAAGARARYGCGHGDPFLADYRNAHGGRRIRDGFDLRQLSITRYGTGRVGKKLCLEPRNIHVCAKQMSDESKIGKRASSSNCACDIMLRLESE